MRNNPNCTTSTRTLRLMLMLVLALFIAACEPMAVPLATQQVIIITAIPSDTPVPTLTATFTPTPTATLPPPATPTPITLPCEVAGGEVVEFNDNLSATAGENLRYRVYVPPCYRETQVRFPVVYLLHGSSYRETQWQNIGVVEALEQAIRLDTLAPMILVMPYFGNIGNLNSFPPNRSYETVILEELVPAIDRDFCTIRNREHRAIGGISRGGFWAVSLTFRHPDVFGAVGGHSAAFDATNAPPAFNPLDLARDAALIDDVPVRILIDNGAEDFAGLSLQTFSNRLTQRQIPHAYNIYPTGGHDEDYWSSHIGEYLEFYGREWEKELTALPSCLESSP